MTRLEEWKNDFKGFINELSMPKDDYNGIMEYIDEVPNEPKWIPVSERLPEKYAHTLWCASSGYVRSDYFNGEFWEDAEKYCYEVVAWMPLPKPFMPQESEKV